MAEQAWHEARLIPTSGINGADEQERRATSALLAVMSSVREFGRVMTQPLGAKAGRMEAYIEVPFRLGEQTVFPDGLLRVTRGVSSWTALLEVKTGTNELQSEQVENYLDVARDHGFDALITISNQIPPSPGAHPVVVDKRRLKKVALHHWSWSEVLAHAVVQKEHRGVADPDQAWILGELIRYLEHPRSGALEFDDMGASWVGVRDAVSAGTLRAYDKAVPEVVARFNALLRYLALRLGRQLGTEVSVVLSRSEAADPGARAQAQATALAEHGLLEGLIRIPHAVAPVVVRADIRARQLTCSLTVEAPRDGKATTRVSWLLRQLKRAPDGLRLEASVARQRGPGASELLGACRDQPSMLVEDPKRDIRSFSITQTRTLGTKRARGRGGFIDSVLDAVDAFYADVVQTLKPWSAKPPQMRDIEESQPVPETLVTTALSSQDGPDEPTEVGQATE